jgi:hypothetical protein
MTPVMPPTLSWKPFMALGKAIIGVKLIAFSAGYAGWFVYAPLGRRKRHEYLDHAEEVLREFTKTPEHDLEVFWRRSRQIGILRHTADEGWKSIEAQKTFVDLVRFTTTQHAKSATGAIGTMTSTAYNTLIDAILGSKKPPTDDDFDGKHR